METRSITSTELAAFIGYLGTVERSAGTIEKYFRDTGRFAAWLEGAEATRERAAAWRDSLLEGGYAPATVNSMVAAVNQFFTFLGWEDCKVKALKIQRKLFRDDRRELTREEYQRLLDAAHGLGRERLALLLETICATGIRVSELISLSIVMAAEMKRTMNDLYEAERKDDTPTPLEQAAAENDGFEEAEPADVEADDEE